MQKIMGTLILICVVLFVVTGCATMNKNKPYSPSANILHGDLVSSGYSIADRLVSQLKVNIDKGIDKDNNAIIVTSFVNINNLTESSTLGRMLAEHVASKLSQLGYKIIELRLRTTSVFMEEGKGEFLLSRDIREVSKNQNANAVVVGTYGESVNGGLYVSARIVRPSDNAIISSCDYALAMDREEFDVLSGKKSCYALTK